MGNSGTFRKGDGRPRRPKGVPNKVTADLRTMILGALEDAGGQEYLLTQAQQNPQAFLTLVGRTLPKEIKAELGAGLLRVLLDGRGVKDA